MKTTTNKKVYIEFLRIIACFFVIVNHTADGITCVFLKAQTFTYRLHYCV